MRSRRAGLLAAGVAACLLAGATAAEEWRPFSATWALSGTRTSVPTEGARGAAILHASGSFVITKGDVVGRGFFGEVVGFDDGGTLLAGRAVFTDAQGDRIYATIKAQPLGTGRTATATITGGTGRWAGLEGDFTFAWRYVVESGEGDFDAVTVNVEGRARRAPPKTAVPTPAEVSK